MARIIDWEMIPNPNSKQKKALKLAVEKAGSAKKLSLLIGCHKSAITKWLNKEIKSPNNNIMSFYFANKIEKALKINDIKYELCPQFAE